MKRRPLTGRDLRRGASEEQLAPGESVLIKKNRGKLFELKRVGTGSKSMNAAMDRLFMEIPPSGERSRTNLARIIVEDRD